jgi:hypothetical protein
VEPDAIALRYVMDNLGPTYLLSGASTIEQRTKHKTYNFKQRRGIKVLNSFKTDSKVLGRRNELSWN